jgi:hypothetical protein
MWEHSLPLRHRGFGLAWLLLSIVFALHVWDEAAHDFLGYYNATVLTLYGHFSWFPRMDMTFREWLIGLLVAIIVCLALTPFAFRNSHRLRPFAYLFAGIQFANGIGHILTTILGGTVPSVRFEGVGPGFYTAPVLLLSSAYLFWRLRATASSPT